MIYVFHPELCSKRTLDIIEYRKNNPCLTLQQVADKFGVSRENIRQKCRRSGIESKSLRYRKKVCPLCKVNNLKRLQVICAECYHKQHNVILICDNCGIEFNRFQTTVIHNLDKDRNKHVFCGRKCFYLFYKGRSKPHHKFDI